MNAAPQCIVEPQEPHKQCAYCQVVFPPKRRWSAFCSDKCRNDYEADFGTVGQVKSVRKIAKGASVVIHLEGPAAERALKLGLKELVRVVRRPG